MKGLHEAIDVLAVFSVTALGIVAAFLLGIGALGIAVGSGSAMLWDWVEGRRRRGY